MYFLAVVNNEHVERFHLSISEMDKVQGQFSPNMIDDYYPFVQ